MSLRVVCSAENNAYTAWQAKLFTFSCLSRLGSVPLVVVHTDHPEDDPVCEDYLQLAELGAPVRAAPQLKNGHPTGILYQPRNTPGSLRLAAEVCGEDYLMLCDPDLVFARRFELPRPQPVSAAYYWSMTGYDCEDVQATAAALGVEIGARRDLMCGVPYVVERAVAGELAEAWLEAIDLMDPSGCSQMYAFGLAALKLGIHIATIDVVQFNGRDEDPLRAPVVHYGFESDGWTKSSYVRPRDISRVWQPSVTPKPGTVTHEIVNQLRAAGDFYSQWPGASGPSRPT